jgi:hypothetical protein
MFYGQSVQETRQLFFNCWQKIQDKAPMSPLEHQIAQVIQEHPEYHLILSNPAQYLHQQYYPEFGETNPFLHMGLHLAIREQVATNRPEGIKNIYLQLQQHIGSTMAAEHAMMEQLAEQIWLSQKNKIMPSDQQYLDALTRLLKEH